MCQMILNKVKNMYVWKIQTLKKRLQVTIAQYFSTSKIDRQILRQKGLLRISVMKTNNGVFVAFKTQHELNGQFSGNIRCGRVTADNIAYAKIRKRLIIL